MADSPVPCAFHIMCKPAGASCNLCCEYCFYLRKAGLYPGSTLRMPQEVHDSFIRQLLAAHRTPLVNIAWQGGEPTLMGLEFFRHSVRLQKRYQKPGTHIENTFQTNGILLNDQWCGFFHENDFLIGLSMDGPRELHDCYRKDKRGRGTFSKVLKAARLLQRHQVRFNILCTVNRKNGQYPLSVYKFFRDELQSRYIQFIPVVEQSHEGDGRQAGSVTDWSVRPHQWGRFLMEVFDEWVTRDVGETFVLNFDAALAGWLGHAGTVCIFGPTCGLGMALEHNGDLYSCDHFVDHDHYLGNILTTPLIDLVVSGKQRRFGADKRDTLPRSCRECSFLSVCNGECPKNRFVTSPDGESGLNYLCAGYRAFFRHADHAMRIMADLIRRGKQAHGVMSILAEQNPDSPGTNSGTEETNRV